MSEQGNGRSQLRARAAAAGRSNGEAGTQVATRPPVEAAPVTIQVRRMEEEFRKAMPAGEAIQFVRDAVTCLQTIKNLDRCEPRSVLGALMTCAQLGLRPAVLGHAWPLPFYDRNVTKIGDDGKPVLDKSGKPVKGGHKAQLIIGYQGYVHLGYESGKVSLIKSSVVREEDDWDWDEGANEPPMHRRPKFGRPRGRVVGYYSVIRTTMGGTLVYAMDVPEMLAFREQFAPRGWKNEETGVAPFVGPWAGDVESANFTGMALKTVLRYNVKTAPKSAQLARAEAVDGTVRIDTSVLSEPAAVSAYAPPALEGGATVEAPSEDVDPTTDPAFGTDQFRG